MEGQENKSGFSEILGALSPAINGFETSFEDEAVINEELSDADLAKITAGRVNIPNPHKKEEEKPNAEDEDDDDPEDEPENTDPENKEDEDEDDEPEETKVEEKPKKVKKGRPTTEEVEAKANAEADQVGLLFEAVAEELGWDDVEELPKTAEELVEHFKNQIEERSVPTYASDEVAELDEFVRNGGRIEDFVAVTGELDLENIDIDDESTQKRIIKEFLNEKGFSQKQISKKLQKYEEADILDDEAEDALEALKEIREDKKEKLLEYQRKQNEQIKATQQKFIDNVVSSIKSFDELNGVKVPEKDKKTLLTYMLRAESDGKTKFQKDWANDINLMVKSAYFAMKGATIIDAAKKTGSNSAISRLKQNLNNQNVSKGSKRSNHKSDNNDVWRDAMKALF